MNAFWVSSSLCFSATLYSACRLHRSSSEAIGKLSLDASGSDSEIMSSTLQNTLVDMDYLDASHCHQLYMRAGCCDIQ